MDEIEMTEKLFSARTPLKLWQKYLRFDRKALLCQNSFNGLV